LHTSIKLSPRRGIARRDAAGPYLKTDGNHQDLKPINQISTKLRHEGRLLSNRSNGSGTVMDGAKQLITQLAPRRSRTLNISHFSSPTVEFG